jgi:cytochrome bd-type quinol oxidase subunit 1
MRATRIQSCHSLILNNLMMRRLNHTAAPMLLATGTTVPLISQWCLWRIASVFLHQEQYDVASSFPAAVD